MRDFLSRNKAEWDELAALVRRARSSIRRLSPEEIRRLDVLYRRTATHLAQVESRVDDPALTAYLAQLLANAHAIIYLPSRRPIWGRIGAVIWRDVPRATARSWRYHAVAALLMLLGIGVAYFAVVRDPQAAYALLPAGEFRQPGATAEQLGSVLKSGRDANDAEKFMFATFLFSNNLKVGILAMTTGVLAAVPCVLLLIFNGMILGALTAVYHGAGIFGEYWAWILPHGVTELWAVMLCGGIGLKLGAAVTAPGLRSRKDSLVAAGREAALMVVGVAMMIFAAAIIESYLRQSDLSTSARFAFAGGSFLFWGAYFGSGFFGRSTPTTDDV
ncbi:MAG: stage II sporulation protein M [Deltaproteobacteria bacterium]|nr:stage II sporulation protein M [Deltaproteobacteria bacterium]MCB9479536.1 stage II sporulation protein M [Deltaproteobacteria bacterium]MCB9488434.1 stage II sporulation protein M [Deltaproteobacteria bacterium]